jgi:hypothetical protein
MFAAIRPVLTEQIVAFGFYVEQLSWHQAGTGQTQIVGRRASQRYLNFVRGRVTATHRAFMWKAISS